jgi:hypothetical protein
MSALTAHGQRATMTQPAIATDVHQTLDVHLHTLAQVAFDLSLRFQNGTNSSLRSRTRVSRLTPASLSTEFERERPMP